MPAPESIHQLVAKFTENREAYRSGKYNEARLRQEFLDPFFAALGWDVYNAKGVAPQYADVIIEESLDIEGGSKSPDYTFKVGPERKFFVEAKKPKVDIQYDIHPAFQLRRYAWNAQLPLSILTDFEELAVYNCKAKPDPSDSAATARDLFFKYTEYAERWDEIAAIFSRDAVWKGALDRYAEGSKGKKGTTAVDAEFLKDMNEWRIALARNIALRNDHVKDEQQLNYAVQMTIDRVIFLRICEDRGIEPEEQLKTLASAPNIYPRLLELFQRADVRYNSGLFHFNHEKGGGTAPDTFTPSLKIDDRVLKDIIKDIYYPCPYIFKEIPVEILGQVYEQFLGQVIRLTPGHQAKVEEKPEVRKAGGVYYTPKYIVDYIVANTVGKLLEGKTPDQVTSLKIVDPACGSGSFLLGAFQYLIDWHEQWYLASDPAKWTRGKAPALNEVTALPGGSARGYRLTTLKKKEILLNNIHGVDIDPQAVEVTKLSLLLKVLEEETGQLSLGLERALPDLGRNIQCGNSLIGEDYFAGQLVVDPAERQRVNPFDWRTAFPQVFVQGGFDAVIGNPPYVFTRSEGFTETEKIYFYKKFPNQTYQLNTYALFTELGLSLLRENGWFGFIVPNNWLTIGSMKKFRDFVINNTGELKIVNNLYKVFLGANVDTSITIFKKSKPNTIILLVSPSPSNVIMVEEESAEVLLQLPIIKILDKSNKYEILIIEKIEKHSIQLCELCDVKAGLKAYETGKGIPKQTNTMKNNRIYHSKTRIDNNYRIYLEGRDVKRYSIKWSGLFLKYGKNLAAPRNSNLFDGKRLLVRQIPSLPPYSINAVLVQGEELNDINSMIIKNTTSYQLEYILGVINSRLITFWFIKKFDKFQRKIFPQFKVNELAQFPIKRIDFLKPKEKREYEFIVELVRLILDLHKQYPSTPQEHEQLQRQIAATDRQIDQLVYQLYGLTDDEIALVEGS